MAGTKNSALQEYMRQQYNKRQQQANSAANNTGTSGTSAANPTAPTSAPASTPAIANPVMPSQVQTPELDKAQGNNTFGSALLSLIGRGTDQALSSDEGRTLMQTGAEAIKKPEVNQWSGRQDLVDEYKKLEREEQAARMTIANGGLLPEGYLENTANRMNEVRQTLEKGDDAAGNGPMSYSGQSRAANLLAGAGQNIASSLTSAAGTAGESVGRGQLMEQTQNVDQAVRDYRFGEDRERLSQETEKANAASHEAWSKVTAAADRLGEGAAKDLEAAKGGLTKLGQAGIDIAENLIEMGFDAAVGAATGGSSLIPMFARTFGSAAQEARRDGATLDEQVLYGTVKGGIEVLTEKMFDGVANIYGKGAADELVEKAIGKLAKTGTGATFLRLLSNSAGEGVEELVSGLLEPLAQAIYRDDIAGINFSTFGLGDQALTAEEARELMQNGGKPGYLSNIDPSELLYSALMGAAVGAIGGAGSIVTGQNAAANRALREAETANAQVQANAEAQTEARSEFNAQEAAQEAVPTTDNAEAQPAPPLAQTLLGQAQEGAEETQQTPLAQTLTGGQEAEAAQPTGVNTGGTRLSETEATVRTSPDTTPEVAQAIEAERENGGFRYLPISNDATISEATQTMERDGFEHTLWQWQKDARRGMAGAKLVAQGYVLYNEAVKSGNTGLAVEILSDLQGMNTNTAQGLQLMRVFQSLNPETKFAVIQRQIDKLSDKYSKQRPDGIKISDEARDAYMQAQDDASRDAALDNIMDEVAKQLPSTLKDKITAIRYLNMLGNLKTQGRNLIGNTVMSAVTTAKNGVKFLAERLAKGVGSNAELTTSLFADRALVDEARADYRANSDAINGESKYSDNLERGFAREAEDRKRVFRSRLLEGYRRATNFAMTAGDNIFIGARYARTLAGYLQANGMDAATFRGIRDGSITPTAEQSALIDRARNYATKEAQEATFHDSNTLADWISSLGRKATTPNAVKVLSEGVMPFRKTPANVLIRAEEYSPLGLVNTAVKAAQASKGTATASDVLNQLSKSLTGTGLFLLGMWLRNNGNLTGHEDDDKQKAFNDLRGQQEYALVLPDGTSFTLDWVAPASMPLFMGAQMMDIFADGDMPSLDELSDVFTSLADPMIEMSMLQGLNDALDNIKYADNNLGTIAINAGISYLTQIMTNSLVGQAERTFEDERYSTFVGAGSKTGKMFERALGKASAKIPGWDKNQVEYVDAWGRTQDTGNALTRGLTNFLSPGYFSSDRSTEVDDELQRLYDNGNNNVFPQRIGMSDKIAIYDENGDKIDERNLTADEYVAFQKTMGQTSLNLVKDLMDSDVYQNMTDEARAAAISDIYKYAKNMAAKEVEPSTKDTYGDVSTLSNIGAYFGTYAAFGDATNNEHRRDYSAVDDLMKSYGDLPDDVQALLTKKKPELAKVYAASEAGINSATYYTVTDTAENLTPPAGYKSPPTWQQVESVMADRNLSQAQQDYFAGLYLTHGQNGKMSTYEKYMAAREANYRPKDIAAFYRIYTVTKGDDRNGDGRADNGTTKKNIVAEAMRYGFSEKQANQLYNMFKNGRWS